MDRGNTVVDPVEAGGERCCGRFGGASILGEPTVTEDSPKNGKTSRPLKKPAQKNEGQGHPRGARQ